MRTYLVGVSLLLPLIISPAFAGEFYVAKDPAKKKCKIVDTKPDGETMIMVGTSSYTTKDEAKAALAKTDECANKRTEFYVGKDPTTKECKIVHKKPDGKKFIMIGTSSYATEEEAKAARLKTTAEECPNKPTAQ